MLSQSIYSFPVTDSTTIEISQEALCSLLSQIELELHAGEVYQRSMAGLQTLLGAAAESAQPMLKAVGREAIRLALGQFARHCQVIAAASQETVAVNPEQPSDEPRPLVREDADLEVAVETHSLPLRHQYRVKSEESETTKTAASYSASGVPSSKQISTTTPAAFSKPNKKLTKAERAAQVAEQQRQELLRHIGQELRQVRLKRALTLRQLYTRTLVPLHQIEALETGRLEELPEDVYLRGFIRRIGYALGLDGIAVAASLPAPDPVKSVVPSWYHANSAGGFFPGGFHLSPVHLYFGYAALVAGAVGGLGCMSQQSSARESIEFNPAPVSPPSVSPSARSPEPAGKPGLQSTKAGMKAGPDIAPPEAF